jgi:DNA topoisomerase-1
MVTLKKVAKKNKPESSENNEIVKAKKVVKKKKKLPEITTKSIKVSKTEEPAFEFKFKKGENYSLVIVESPSKAKTIKKYLGRGYQVIASNGHIKDLPKSKLGVDVKNNFAIDLVPIAGKNKVLEKLSVVAKHADRIYLAPDPDREGEAIAFHLKEEFGKKKKVHRVLFNAITKNAVIKAIQEPTELDSNKYDSQKTRRVLDRLVGYKISPILWEKVQRGLSAGRVQSVALRIIVEREQEIQKFNPEQWFSIHAQFEKDKKQFEAKYYGEQITKKNDLLEETIVKKIVKDVKNKPFTVVEVKKRERKQNPTPPFTTSKLQQEAANKLGFSAKKTMMVAQKLYEGVQTTSFGQVGLITYMRTDSTRTAPEAVEQVRQFIKKRYGALYLPTTPNEFKSKKANKSKVQDAHEAIRPSSLEYHPDEVKGDLENDQFRLYTLIWNKFVASQMTQAVVDQTAVTFENSGHFFKANGSIIKFTGFREVYLEAAMEKRSKRGEDDESEESAEENESFKSTELPLIDEKEIFSPIKEVKSEEHWTSPPPRYNEASIVKELEEQGIGRPSTYASIISNITDRGYVEKTENRFIPTEVGQVVCKMLMESFPKIMDIAFTASVENLLDDIEDGSVNWRQVLKDFWKDFEKTLETAKEEMKNLKKQEIPTGIKCRKCVDGKYFIKWGRNGQFLACNNYPTCTSTEDFKRLFS